MLFPTKAAALFMKHAGNTLPQPFAPGQKAFRTRNKKNSFRSRNGGNTRYIHCKDTTKATRPEAGMVQLPANGRLCNSLSTPASPLNDQAAPRNAHYSSSPPPSTLPVPVHARAHPHQSTVAPELHRKPRLWGLFVSRVHQPAKVVAVIAVVADAARGGPRGPEVSGQGHGPHHGSHHGQLVRL